MFKIAKFDFSVELEVSTSKIFLISAFVIWLDKSTLSLISPPNGSYSLGNYWLIFIQDHFYQSSY